MKKNSIFIIVFIFIVAFFLRFYRLDKSPPSLNWDEVAIGWNAWTIFKTRRDEFGTYLPLAFRSFGDYKSPLLIYLTAPVVGLFGLSEWTVRFPSALFGSLTVLVVYFLVKELFSRPKEKPRGFPSPAYWRGNSSTPGLNNLAGLASFLLAISPWHLQFSRAAFEANLALFFIVLGTWLFLKGLKRPFFYIFSFLCYAFSLYAYHSPKIFLPPFLFCLFLIYRRQLFLKKEKKGFKLAVLLAALTIGLTAVYPLAKLHLKGEGGARFSGTTIFYSLEGEKKALSLNLFLSLVKNYLVHFSPAFLFFGNNKNPRINIREFGPLYLIELPLLVVGLLVLIKQRKSEWARVLVAWLLIGPLPATIGRDSPHTVRALNMLPALIIVLSLGLIEFMALAGRKIRNKLTLYLLPFTIYFVFLALYFYSYHFKYPAYAAKDWQYGYQQMARYVQKREAEFDKIIVSSQYGQPHIFVYFWQKRDPLEVFWGGMSKYVYRDINWEEDQYLENVLLVGTPRQIPLAAIPKWERDRIIKEIMFPDGSVAFRIIGE